MHLNTKTSVIFFKTLFGWLPTNRQPNPKQCSSVDGSEASGDVGTLGRSDFLQVDGGSLGEVEPKVMEVEASDDFH